MWSISAYPSTSREPEREEDCFNPNDYEEVSTSVSSFMVLNRFRFFCGSKTGPVYRRSPKTPFIPPSKREDAPLASILNPQLDNIDPRRFFADYEHDAVVRFSRIFASNIKSTSKAEIWWPSKTFHKKVAAESSQASTSRPGEDFGFRLPSRHPHLLFQEYSTDREPEGRLLPAELIEWEEDIMIEGDDFRDEVLDELKYGVEPACGWVPTQYTRTYEQYMLNYEFSQCAFPDIITEPSASHSLFPHDFVSQQEQRWEDNVILDPKQVDRIAGTYNDEPKILSLDYLDDPLIYGMPDDRRPDDMMDTTPNKPFDRKEHQFTKKSKMILGQVQQRQKQEEEEQMETSVAQLTDKDPFNLSNDDYYLLKAINKSGPAGNSMLIQHSIPAQNIHRTFFPTFLIPSKLRHFHRIIFQQREKQRCAEGGGDIFFMRDVADLSGRDGDLMLLEYSEEHPPLLCQPGMASKIKNYYKKKPGKDVDPDFEFGEMAYLHSVPFLGQLQPGQAMQSIENNLRLEPIECVKRLLMFSNTIRSSSSWYVRPCPPEFLVGQQCPLYEVPSPNSKRATIFVRDFLLAFIYRLFWASEHRPRRLKMDDIKAAFPHYAESSVRKRLKQCSDFKRLGTGPDQNYWVLRPEFRLPSKEEVLAMVTPEMCCAQYSMLAAEQRLKDAGYGEKYFFTPENEDDSDDQVTIEDEIKCAPWNTTRAFLSSMRGKCLLDQTGIADPTGCGQGFSYVRVSQKPQKDDTPAMPKRLVTGTNADLRKLPLKEAKEICRDYGVREEEINALSRWEIIDVIRTLSTQAAKAKADSSGDHGNVSGMARFARGNIRFNFADMQEKYKKHCQHIFDLQNQTLANPETLSTDEGSSGEDSDNEELATRLETMLQANKGKKHISMSERARMEFENEEKERQDLKRMVHGDATNKGDKDKKEATAEERKNVSKIGEDLAASASKISGITANQKLKIYRTMKNPDGTESTRVEVVTRPQLIEAYTRIRMTKDENFIEVYAQMDEQFKEERRKQKRRLQDQLRRIRRNEERGKTSHTQQRVVEKKPIPIKPNLQKMRCSACHGTGHMKTNKNCPLYGKDPLKTPGKDGGSGTSDGDDEPSSLTGELVAVEGTKVKISRKVINSHEQSGKKKKSKYYMSVNKALVTLTAIGYCLNRSVSISEIRYLKESISTVHLSVLISVRPRLNAGAGTGSVKRRASTLPEEDYLQGPHKSVQRIRADPKVTMGTLLTEIVNELKTIPGSEHLMFAVNAKKVLAQLEASDVKRMLDNSRLYNGDNHVITDAAKKMFELASKRLVEKEQQLMKLEKAINPLLDDNDRVGFGFVLEKIVQACKNIPKSVPFHTRVDAKKGSPAGARTSDPSRKNLEGVAIQCCFQILVNSELYNGPAEKSSYTAKATEIVALADKMLAEHAVQVFSVPCFPLSPL
ncbi:unnamed protein product [Heligmosomoides polygyrus]|uniref:Transcription initiation factor TFIID subunit 1 histone acetyltransferase domain-containing protein n=1 Tax=Heligmosomoides polygyrus TaxID=6339 RepID=A0A3P7YJI7_HELPZ|nr:unnamed protein product [Heligmosomoides polygyrus]